MQRIPHGFTQYPQFIIYKTVPSSTRAGKLDKLPIDYRTGFKVDLTDPTAWTTAEVAAGAATCYGENYGVGFVFTEQDPFWFLDIDNCVINGNWSPLALSLLNTFPGAAVEVSTSGTGLHIFGSGRVPAHTSRNAEHGLEFYTQKRFVALTGVQRSGSALTDHTPAVNWLIQNYFSSAAFTPASWTTSPCADWNGPASDDVLITRMLQSESFAAAMGKGARFIDLWENNREVLDKIYSGDDSSIDAALAQHLTFWTGNDCERMQRLMLRSKLTREKWQREDYLPRTILSACSKATKFLQDKAVREINIETNTPLRIDEPVCVINDKSTFLNIEQQQKLFKGCVYVEETRSVLVPGGDLLKPDQFNDGVYAGYTFPLDAANQKITRKAWEAFTQSQIFTKPFAHRVCFRPQERPGMIIPEEGKFLVNKFYPCNTARKVGDPSPFLNHLAKLFPPQLDQTILLSYFAACVQYQGIKFQWAPFIQGVPGNGKTLLTWCVANAIGNRYVSYPRADQISAKFNYWMFEKILIGIEDIYVPYGQQEVIETLKPMITNEYQPIEPKGVDMKTREVCCNFIINSNHKDGLPKTYNDRRFAPFFSAQQQPEDLARDGITPDYLSELHDWLRYKEGYAIVNEFLQTYSIPHEYNPANRRKAPITSSTEDAIEHGRGGMEQEIIEAVDQGLPGFKGGWISSIALDRLLRTINAERKLPRNKRKDVLHGLGYILHPALGKDGRVNVAVMPDGAKPKLFIKKDHELRHITGAAEIAKLYSDAQA